MRPVKKWNVGEEGVCAEYNPYRNAKSVLLRNFGHGPHYYCNYCDRLIPMVNLAVEHILPYSKLRYNHLKYSWPNFLLSCSNCNLSKSNENINLEDFYWPHIHNTRPLFVVEIDGTLSCHPRLTTAERTIAQRMLRLFRFDCGHTNRRRQKQDDRYAAREYVLRLANRKLNDRLAGNIDDEGIVELAVTNGFWLVWMQVFHAFPGILNGLTAAFKNTYDGCLSNAVERP